MTLLRMNNRPAAFNSFVDDFFATIPSFLRDDLTPGRQMVPVNIRETDESYVMELVAPGLNKEDFKVNLDHNILSIEAEKKTEEEKINGKQIRREYKFQSFKRSFTLDENIDADGISAQYVNGVLTLNLPKKGEVKTSAKQIAIQ